MKFLPGILLSFLLLASCTSRLGKILKSKDKEYKLKMAEQFYVKKDYSKAQQLYSDLLPLYKGDARFEDIYYKYAYTAYYQKDYMNAENLFKTYGENFPNSARVEETEFMRCMAYYKQSPKVDLDQTNTVKTIALLQAFINTHPDSKRVEESNDIIDKCRAKLELKEFNNAKLYYDLGYFKAAGVAFSVLIDDYPDSDNSDSYALSSIKAYYKYAELSVIDKQEERYQKVVADVNDFEQRFPQSKLLTDAVSYRTLAENNLKKLQTKNNEQTKETTQR
ncbi:outer membrane protein assembly factor BamD [Parafilimonas sp.]|uniref:outer membrane protein assembly factor BamD n=1 Tax=Parafilimonas sp. TaxID=1969739 RepID=UPI0039E38A46